MSTILRTKTIRWIPLTPDERRTLTVALQYWEQKWALPRGLPATAEGQEELRRIRRLRELLTL